MMITLPDTNDEVFEAERVNHLAVERAKNFYAAWPRPIDAARNSIANIIRRDIEQLRRSHKQSARALAIFADTGRLAVD